MRMSCLSGAPFWTSSLMENRPFEGPTHFANASPDGSRGRLVLHLTLLADTRFVGSLEERRLEIVRFFSSKAELCLGRLLARRFLLFAHQTDRLLAWDLFWLA
jgi:hypothetical protein